MSILLTFLFMFSNLPHTVERIPVTEFSTQGNPFLTGVVDIQAIGPDAMKHLKEDFQIAWWVENNHEMLIHAHWKSFLEIAKEYSCGVLNKNITFENLVFAKFGAYRDIQQDHFILTRAGAFAVIELSPSEAWQFKSKTQQNEHHSQTKYWPFQPNTTLVALSSNKRSLQKTSTRSFQNLVDSIDGPRWYADIQVLASFNRYTHRPGNLNARDWLESQFTALPGLTVSTEAFTVGATTTYNVMAVLPGSTRPDDWYIVGGHFDSTSENTSSSAPGAEDNASGTAGVLEMARIFTAQPPDATIIFICFSGEEQGLNGSEFHVSQLQSAGTQGNVLGVINMDMIGYTGDPELDCLLETETFALSLSQTLERAAADYTSLVISTSTNAWGSDHVPYLNAGMPAVLTIENDWNSYSDYHKTTDLPTNISIPMGVETLKMNVAALAEMAFSRANLEFDSTQLLNAGSNGVADPGETLQLNFSLMNSGHVEGTAVSCTMTSSSALVTVLQNTSTYPNISAGTKQLNTTPFEIVLDPDLPCGDRVILRLEVVYHDFQTHTVQFDVSLPTGTIIGKEVSVSPNLVIPDNNATGITSTINISGSGLQVSSAFNIDMNINHSYIGDLTVDLVSPGNTTIRLWDKSGSGTNNLEGNFPNSLTPAEPLDGFLGEALDGDWVLHVTDTGASDQGTLTSWGINDIQGHECDPGACSLNLTVDVLDGGPPLVNCAGDLISVVSTLINGSGAETFSWEIVSGTAVFEGDTTQPIVAVRPFSNTTLRCVVTDSGCTGSATFDLAVTRESSIGDDYIRAEDLYFLIQTYWKTDAYDPGFDFDADGSINLLDLLNYTQCL